MNPYLLIAGGLAMLSLILGSFHVGRVYERAGVIEADLTQAQKIIVKQQIIIQKVPQIVTKVVTQEVKVTEEVERVVAKIPDLLAPDCVLPDRYGMLLASAANGVDPSTGGSDAFAGEYGCREVLAATLKDLQAGWRNSARLAGLQETVRLVMEKP